MQIRELYKEQVASGRMEEKRFHDEILRGGPMPIRNGPRAPGAGKAPARFQAHLAFRGLKMPRASRPWMISEIFSSRPIL